MAKNYRRSPFRCFLNLERMEDRLTPATFTVTNTLGDTSIGSLRWAIGQANGTPGADTINFAGSVTGTITPAATLSISDSVTIDGPGAEILAISGNFERRIFDTTPAANTAVITIRNLKLTAGHARTFLPANTVANVGGGGAIVIQDEIVNITDCDIVGNTARNFGGAILIGLPFASITDTGKSASVTIRGTTIANNSVQEGSGGAIYAFGDEAITQRNHNLVIDRSTLSQNTATYNSNVDNTYGGAICWAGRVGTGSGFQINNSTIHNNSSTKAAVGGAIATITAYGKFQITHSTITNNRSNGLDTAGIFNISDKNAVSFFLLNSIVAGNSSITGQYINDFVSASPMSVTGSNSIIGITPSVGVTYSVTGLLSGTQASPLDAKLGPLQNNGGRILTRMPLAGSPAIDNGTGNYTGNVDARGVGFPRTLNAVTDLGAVEYADWVVRNDHSSGKGALSTLIQDANEYAGPNTITFDPNAFDNPQIITFPNQVTIDGSLTIIGPGANFATLRGQPNAGILNLDSVMKGQIVNISGLRFDNGSRTEGGAINAKSEILTISDCRFTSNDVTGNGGAISMSGTGTLTIQRSLFENNTADLSGGAIFVSKLASVSIIDCTFSNNTVDKAATITQGGGAIHISDSEPTPVLIRGCTFTNNASTGASAGAGNGGAILLNTFAGTLNVQNSTITNNKTNGSFGGGGIARVGGTAGEIYLVSSIISNNIHDAGSNEDLYSGNLIDADFSAIGVTTGAASLQMDSTTTSLVGQNFQLGALANNGGTLQTILPAATSPVRDRGANPGNLTLDARGSVRVWNGQADIGAVELPPDLIVRNANDTGPSSLRQTILDANTIAGANTINFDSAFFSTPRTITMGGTEMAVSDSLTLNGPGSNLLTIDADAKSRVFNLALGVTFNASKMSLIDGIGNGGAIFSDSATVVLGNVVISGHNAAAGGGTQGAIRANGGSLSITDSMLSANTAWVGAAIHMYNSGLLNVTRTTVAGNSAGSVGGGITLVGTLNMQNSTVSGNKAFSGGGLYLDNIGASMIRNSTFSGNKSVTFGGNSTVYGTGSLGIQNSTIVYGSAGTIGGGISRDASASNPTAPPINIESTIIAGNAPSDLAFNSNPATITNCLVGSGPFGGAVLTSTIVGQDPLLGPLQSNGGTTQNHRPLSNSPVVGKGSNPAGLTSDQTGVFSRSVGGSTDIGAVEALPGVVSVVPSLTAISDANVGAGKFAVTVNYNMPMNTTQNPFLTFSNGQIGSTLTAINSASWIDNKTYRVIYNVADAGITLPNCGISVSGGVSTEMIGATSFTAANLFDIDTQNPVIASITSTSQNGDYITGQAINFKLNFSEPVTLNGSLTVAFNNGGTAIITGNGSLTDPGLSGSYTVGKGQNTTDLTVTSLVLASGTLRDAFTNAAVLTVPSGTNLGNSKDISTVGTILGITVNGGASQRSRLTTIQVDLSSLAGDISTIINGVNLVRTAARPGDAVGTIVDKTSGLIISPASGASNTFTLSFANVSNAGVNNGSLADGRWQLNIPSLGYTSHLGDTNFRRLFGDNDNNGTVDAADFSNFGNLFGMTQAGLAFDFDANNTVDAADFAQFGNRFGVTL